VISLVDTPAAESRLDAEERGISNAIAENMELMSSLRTPIVVTIIGEGGSGGAIGLAVGDHVMMLEHAIYSVIPPESCAVILSTFGRDASRAPEAAEALRLAARETMRLGAVDEVIEEPLGGAHRDPVAAAANVKEAILRALGRLEGVPVEQLVRDRYNKYRSIGHYRG
jgi:acetyl-CoA carboxylase carboxyl transferase subunit alpha